MAAAPGSRLIASCLFGPRPAPVPFAPAPPGEPLFARASVAPDATGTAHDAARWVDSPWDAARQLEAAEFHRAMMQEGFLAH